MVLSWNTRLPRDEIPSCDIISYLKPPSAVIFRRFINMDLLLQWRYGVGPPRLIHKALAVEAGVRREKIRDAIAAGPNPQAKGPLSHRAKQSVVFDMFIEEYRNTMVRDERKFIIWQALVEAHTWGEKEAEQDFGRGHPHPAQPDSAKTAMKSIWDAIRAGDQWFALAFENFVGTYHLTIMPGDSGLGDNFTHIRDRVLGNWRRHLERRSKLTKTQYPTVARSEAQNYNALADAQFALVTRIGPEPANAPGGPPPTTSDKPEESDPMSEQPTGIGACPKTYRTAHYLRGQLSDSDDEYYPSTTDL